MTLSGWTKFDRLALPLSEFHSTRRSNAMHMLSVIAGGIVLLGVFLLFGHLWGDAPASLGKAAKLFMPVWLAVSITNMWIGVSKAGYTVTEEMPVLLIVFGVPAIVAAVAAWHFAKS